MNLFENLFKKNVSETIRSETVQEMGFGGEILILIKEAGGTELRPLRNYHAVTIGLSFMCKQEEADPIIDQLRAQIRPTGFLPFISETDVGRRNNSIIGIVQTESQFELLKLLDTNGANYDVGNEDVIAKLKEWHNRHPFAIIGANFDWVELAFEQLPPRTDLVDLAKEVIAFCPDAVEFEEDEASIEETVKSMEETKKIFLWWD